MYRNLQNFVFFCSRASKLSTYSKFFLLFALFAVTLSFSRSLAQGNVDSPFCYMETEDGTIINLEGFCTPSQQEEPAVNARPLATTMSPEEYRALVIEVRDRIREKTNSLCPNGYCLPGVDLEAEIDAICASYGICPRRNRQVGYIER